MPSVGETVWMAHVHMFCDESGKVHNSDYISFCAFLGNNEQWTKLLPAWKALRIALHVPPIHVSAILHPTENNGWLEVKNRWGSDWDHKSEEMLDDFASIIEGAKVVSVGAVVDARSFRGMSLPLLKAELQEEDPHYFAFEVTVLTSLEKVTWGGSEDVLGLQVDDDEEKAILCYQLLRSLKSHSAKARERIGGICFVSDALYPGIQAADMLSHEARRLMVEHLPPSERFLKMTYNLAHEPTLFDAAYLQKMEDQLVEESNKKGL
jgi:hypothetical protein